MEGDDHHQREAAEIIDIKCEVIDGSSNVCKISTCILSDPVEISKENLERQAAIRKLQIAVTLCVIFMTVEVIGGIKANSLAILTDAAHLLSDVAAFAISLFSLWAASWEANPRQSYGFYRIEILGALVSIQLIWLLTGILVYEAIVRLLYESGEVQGSLMFAVAAFGLAVNIIMATMLGHGGHNGHDHDHAHHAHDHADEALLQDEPGQSQENKRNINVQGAYIHVLGDCIQSVGVMIGGAIIWYKPEWKIIDLLCTIFFSLLVMVTTINLLRSVLDVLMESTPREIDTKVLEQTLLQVDGVVAVHELHVWAITIGKVLLACHVTTLPEVDSDVVLDRLVALIKKEFSISHVTIQIERQS